jgi:hypothetical protein
MLETDLAKMKKWPLARKVRAFREAQREVQKALRKFPQRMWGYSPKPGTHWCIQEIFWHLADAEMHASVRFRQALAEPNTAVIAWDQVKWGAAPPYRRLSAQLALKVFFALREANSELLKGIPKKAWRNKVRHPEYGVRTLEDLLVMNAWHIHKHIGQMNRRFNEWEGR